MRLKDVFKWCFLLAFFSFITPKALACTTIIATKEATQDGSIIIAHTDDDEVGDQRIVKINAKDYKKGDKRPIYKDATLFPRYVGKDRSKAYDTQDAKPFEPIGYIDQVEHTYNYIEGNYGIINEHELAFGECTNSTYFFYDVDPKKRIMGIFTLSQIALERCKKAKEAIVLMGELAEKYGYYGFGETLLVGDTEDAYVFEISCDPKGESAIWVAKKVPAGEVFVAANQFRIQEIDPNNENFLYSSNLYQIAKEQNWTKDNQLLNWQKSVCPGEFDHPYYSLRRVWRVLSKMSPASNLSPYVESAFTKYYPFSIKPDKKLSVQDVISLIRDHYEGTEFDLTKGLAAGPFGCPNRYIGDYDRVDFPNQMKKPLEGAWERSISIYYTGFSYVTQLRGSLPHGLGGLTWIGFDDPYQTCFIPIYAGVESLPKSFEYGNPQKFDPDFAWWIFNYSANWTDCFYDRIIGEVQKTQTKLEKEEFDNQKMIEEKALQYFSKDPKEGKKYLTTYCRDNANNIVNQWWDLAKFILAKFTDGFDNLPNSGSKLGYPAWWLKDVGYEKGPTSYKEK
ncbi:MAG: C69 family dipeptidase [Chlamydiae bacterium]|nr:C69 family dipeptidase [Chlamydiota bacterium]